jgi:hypothetical protein
MLEMGSNLLLRDGIWIIGSSDLMLLRYKFSTSGRP